MSRKPKRRVRRNSGGRQELVRSITERSWFQLPDWGVAWLEKYAGRVVFGMVILLTPIALLAVVLGFNSLPLHIVGMPAEDNGLGLKAVLFLFTFSLLALAVKPLMRGLRRGWWLVIAAAAMHVTNNVVSGEGFSGILLLLLSAYLYAQVRYRLD